MFDIPTETLLSWANKARFIGLATAAIAALIGWAATWAQAVWQSELTAKKDAELKQFQIESKERIAATETEAAKAHAEAGRANEAAAKAHERAAALENATEQARLEQERLKQQLAWRSVSPEQLQKLQALLTVSPQTVTLAYISNDSEALHLAIQISKAIEGANWKIRPEARTYGNQIIFGLRIPGPETSAVRLLRTSFVVAGIPFTSEDVPPPDMTITYGAEPNAPLVFVGSKRPPF